MISPKRIVKIFLSLISVFLIVETCSNVSAQGFKLTAVSDSPGNNLKIVLMWPETQDMTSFNLFRKKQEDPSYSVIPINPGPIKRITDCNEIKSVLGVGSSEWILIQNALADSIITVYDPCNIGSVTTATDKRKYDILMMLAHGNYKISMLMGLSYEDKTVVNGQKYVYKIEGINSTRNIVTALGSDVFVTAGLFVQPDAPTGVTAEAGDSKVQICWNRNLNPDISGYKVFRLNSILHHYEQINTSNYTTVFTNKLNGDTLNPNTSGFIDFQRYDLLNGLPISHKANGIDFYGPFNNVKYYYKVCSTDILGRKGPDSPVDTATPFDSTPPQAPVGLMVTPDESNSSFRIRWQRVKQDINSHIEKPGVKSYSLYRYESIARPDSGSTLVTSGIPNDQNPDVLLVNTVDNSQGLRVKYVDKTWYYRVVALDAANNISAFSAAIGGVMKDTTRPALVKGIRTEGGNISIFLSWIHNSEPDIQGYMIYRGYCNFGNWAECIKKSDKPGYSTGLSPECNDGFVFLGQVDQNFVIKTNNDGTWAFEDRTVPPGSPMCYAYWIKAVDKSGNISGSYPKPISSLEKATIVCQRLRDKRPPEPALISGLRARNNAVLVEWMGPPTQDIHSYYVYRAVNDDSLSYKFVAQVTVEYPPRIPKTIYSKYRPIVLDGCDSIPYAINEYMTAGSFLDKNVDPKKIFWYRVTGVDQNGNEGFISKAIGVSTFTFTSDLAAAPTITSIETNSSPCGLLLKWTPLYSSVNHTGFAIFKSTTSNGQYYQVTQPVAGNQFIDANVVKGKEYWYRITLLDVKGMVSKLSEPKSCIVNP